MAKEKTEIKRITEIIVKKYKPEKIILFGSFAWGKPGPDSDVDLLVIKRSSRNRFDRESELRDKLSHKDFPAMDVLVYTPEEVKKSINERKNLFIEDIFRNGKVLYANPKSGFVVTLPKRPLKILH